MVTEVKEFLEDVTGSKRVYFKDSHSYNGEWKLCEEVTVNNPIQRRLTAGECVLDLDNVTDTEVKRVLAWLDSVSFKYTAWKSSNSGVHIHFWVNVKGKEKCKKVTELIADRLLAVTAVTSDLQPMSHGFIRCEYSYHPSKGVQKVPLKSTINIIDPINLLPKNIMEQLPESEFINFAEGKSKEINGKMPKCIRYILSHQFSDGRQRLIFVLASWYKANGKSNDENVNLCKEWADRQGYYISEGKIRAFIDSTNGTVGCRFRHGLLEEIGVDMSKCEYV